MMVNLKNLGGETRVKGPLVLKTEFENLMLQYPNGVSLILSDVLPLSARCFTLFSQMFYVHN